MQTSRCGICTIHNKIASQQALEIYRGKLWLLRHHPEPAPMKGWLLLDSIRHIQSPINFTNEEAISWGLMVQKASDLVQKLTHCERVYLIAFGEGAKHLHLHLIPRFEKNEMTNAWSIADHYRNVLKNTERAANSNDIARLVKEARTLFK